MKNFLGVPSVLPVISASLLLCLVNLADATPFVSARSLQNGSLQETMSGARVGPTADLRDPWLAGEREQGEAPPAIEFYLDSALNTPISDAPTNRENAGKVLGTRAPGSAGRSIRPASGGAPAAGIQPEPSADPSQRGTRSVGGRSGSTLSQRTNITLRNVARALINRISEEEFGGPAAGDQIAYGSGTAEVGASGFSILDAVLDIEMSPQVVRTLARIFSPTISVDGVVSFDLVGFGDFAFVVASGENGIRIVNTETGASVLIHSGGLGQSMDNSPLQRKGPQPSGVVSEEGRKLVAILNTVKRWFFEYGLHPFTLSTLAFVLIVSMLLGLRRREV